MKENQKLKCLNSDSTHAKHCVKAIPNGSFKRLAKSASVNSRMMNNSIDEIHPDHAKALRTAGLSPKKFPTLKEVLMSVENDKQKDKKKKKLRKRITHFCISICKTWTMRDTWNNAISIHVILERLRDKCNLKWLRMSMSYHEFTNLGEIFQGDLSDKLMDGMTSKDSMDLNCNCIQSATVNGKCICGSNCRKSMVAHKATCEECGCYCVGNTQQKLKMRMRMNQHFTNAKDLINNNKLSDSFAKHFASHFQDKKHMSRGDVRNITNIEIIWQGNPISSIKTFRNLNCTLCAKECLEIYKAMKLDNKNNSNFLINSSNELCGGCRYLSFICRQKTCRPRLLWCHGAWRGDDMSKFQDDMLATLVTCLLQKCDMTWSILPMSCVVGPMTLTGECGKIFSLKITFISWQMQL